MENEERGLVVRKEYTADERALIKETVAKGLTDLELKLFEYQCRRTGLDPFNRQIHAVKRWDSTQKKKVMTIQVGIDGYRLISERTGNIAPGREPTFHYKEDGALLSATAYLWKQVGDRWFEVSATAFYDEYVQNKKDGTPNHFWGKMPHSQLAKCAETLAHRKCSPQDLSGLYTHAEMMQGGCLFPLSRPAIISCGLLLLTA